jgi:hypothetical protein
MHRSHYQPKRSQHLYLVEKLRERYGWTTDAVVVHHVLEDSTTRLWLQLERRFNVDGTNKIVFERVEL